MMNKILIFALGASLLAGCSTFKKVTGQQNDTVLPGQREDILPSDQQTARDPGVTGKPGAPAAPIKPVVASNTMKPAPLAPPPAETVTPQTQTANVADPNCDPNVDLCPENLAPEPLPPPSKPLPPEPKKTKIATADKATAADKKMAKVADKPTNAVKLIKSKKKKKPAAPKTLAPATPATQAAPAAPAQ